MNTKYNFVAVEGNMGVGKTSLARMLVNKYNGELILEEFINNPFLPKFYSDIERYAFPTEVFFLMDRHRKLTELVASQTLQEGFNVTDYLLNKSLLYAQVNLRAEEYLLFERLFHTLHLELPQPDLLIYLHARIPRLIKNIRRRGRGHSHQVWLFLYVFVLHLPCFPIKLVFTRHYCSSKQSFDKAPKALILGGLNR